MSHQRNSTRSQTSGWSPGPQLTETSFCSPFLPYCSATKRADSPLPAGHSGCGTLGLGVVLVTASGWWRHQHFRTAGAYGRQPVCRARGLVWRHLQSSTFVLRLFICGGMGRLSGAKAPPPSTQSPRCGEPEKRSPFMLPSLRRCPWAGTSEPATGPLVERGGWRERWVEAATQRREGA